MCLKRRRALLFCIIPQNHKTSTEYGNFFDPYQPILSFTRLQQICTVILGSLPDQVSYRPLPSIRSFLNLLEKFFKIVPLKIAPHVQ